MFAQRLAGHSLAPITRALNDAGIPCPSAADPKRNPDRSGGLDGSAGRLIVGQQVEELIGVQAAEFDGAAAGCQADGCLQGDQLLPTTAKGGNR